LLGFAAPYPAAASDHAVAYQSAAAWFERAPLAAKEAPLQRGADLPAGCSSQCVLPMTPCQMVPVMVFQVPMVVCGMPAPQQYPQQQQLPQACHEPASDDGLFVQPALSTSARRRLRRQRAELRGPRAAEDATAEVPTFHSEELSSPRSGSGTSSSDELAPALESGSSAPSGRSERFAFDALTAALRSGGEARNAALAKLRGSVAELTFDRRGCRLVQDAIQVADHALAAELVPELHGLVRDASASPHGNYVLQTIVTTLPSATSSFVVKELIGAGAATARHRFGCRILCRLIEHSGANGELSRLISEVLVEGAELVQHPFAHHVVECVLEHLPEWRPRAAEALASNLVGNARHQCASRLVEAALRHCAEEEQQKLADGLLGEVGVVTLAHHPFGCFVLKSLLRVPGAASSEARRQLAKAAPSLGASRPGQRLLRDLGLNAAAAPAA